MTARLLRTTMFRPCTLVRREVSWNRLLFRYTDPKERDRLARLQAKFGETSSKHGSLPKDLKDSDINFSEWRQKIKTPGIVDELEKMYRTAMAQQTTLNSTERAGIEAQQDAEIKAVEAKASTSSDFLSELRAELEWLKPWYDRPMAVAVGSNRSWNKFQTETLYPYFPIYRMNKVMFYNDQLQDEGRPVARINDVDIVELRKQLRNGNVRAYVGALAPIAEQVGDLTWAKRPFFKKWLGPPKFAEWLRDPSTNIHYRAWALRQLR